MMIAIRAHLTTACSFLEWQKVGHGMLIGAALGLILMGSAWVLMRALELVVGGVLALLP